MLGTAIGLAISSLLSSMEPSDVRVQAEAAISAQHANAGSASRDVPVLVPDPAERLVENDDAT